MASCPGHKIGFVGLVIVVGLSPSCSGSSGQNMTDPLDPGGPVGPVESRGSIRVTTLTEGDPYSVDRDGYTVVVGDESRPIATIGTMNFMALPVGEYLVGLIEAADNCAVTGDNPRRVGVAKEQSTPIHFVVTCVTLTGTLRVKTITNGPGQDADGYLVSINQGPPDSIGRNETKTYENYPTGRHEVVLSDLEGGCELHSSNVRVLTLYGGLSSEAIYHVSCQG